MLIRIELIRLDLRKLDAGENRIPALSVRASPILLCLLVLEGITKPASDNDVMFDLSFRDRLVNRRIVTHQPTHHTQEVRFLLVVAISPVHRGRSLYLCIEIALYSVK